MVSLAKPVSKCWHGSDVTVSTTSAEAETEGDAIVAVAGGNEGDWVRSRLLGGPEGKVMEGRQTATQARLGRRCC